MKNLDINKFSNTRRYIYYDGELIGSHQNCKARMFIKLDFAKKYNLPVIIHSAGLSFKTIINSQGYIE